MTRQRTRRARATLYCSLVGFAFLQLALGVSIELWLPQFRDPYYGQRINLLRLRTVAAAPPPFTVLMLGTSRTRNGLLGKSLERQLRQAQGRPIVVFNFGQNSAGPMTELFNLKRLLADGIHPDLLLVEVLPPLLCEQEAFDEAGELRLPAHRLRSDDLPLVERYGRPSRSNIRREWWQATLVPWYSHRLKILSSVAPLLISRESRYEGIDHLDDTCSFDLDSPRSRVAPDPGGVQYARALERAHDEYYPGLANFHLGGRNCEALGELLTLCRESNVSTALVLMPEGPLFRSWYRPEDWTAIENYLGEIGRAYRTPVINCRTWIAEEDFLDSHHLRRQGAAEFTRHLGIDGIQPQLNNGFSKGPLDVYDAIVPDKLTGHADKPLR